MLIGIVSDTHGHISLTLEAARQLEPFAITTVLHCGDIGSPEIPRCFLRWPAHFVLGNVDRGRESELESAMQPDHHFLHGEFGDLRFGTRRVALLHGDDPTRLRREVQAGQWDLICVGHTHRPRMQLVGATRILNPGAIFRSRPHTVALVDLGNWEVRWLEF